MKKNFIFLYLVGSCYLLLFNRISVKGVFTEGVTEIEKVMFFFFFSSSGKEDLNCLMCMYWRKYLL